MRRWNPVQLASYAVVMGVGTGLDVLCQTSVNRIPGTPLFVAVVAGFLANVFSGYFMSRRFVFPISQAGLGRSALRYALLVGLNVLIGIVGVTFLVVGGWPYVAGRLVSSAVLVPTNYVVLRSWVFDAG